MTNGNGDDRIAMAVDKAVLISTGLSPSEFDAYIATTDRYYDKLMKLGIIIRAESDNAKGAMADFAESVMRLAIALRDARDIFPSNTSFSLWLFENQLDDLGKTDRAALIKMAEHEDIARVVLEEGRYRSPRLLWEEMSNRVPLMGKTTPSLPELPKTQEICGENDEVALQKEQEKMTAQFLEPEFEPDAEITNPPKTLKGRPSAFGKFHPRLAVLVAGQHSNIRATLTAFAAVATNARKKHPDGKTDREIFTTYCDGLVKAIESGWQLPNRKNLQLAWGVSFDNHSNRGFYENQKYGPKEGEGRRFLNDLWAVLCDPQPVRIAPLTPQPLPEAKPGVNFPHGKPVVMLNGRQFYPPRFGADKWTIDDACVCVHVVTGLWASFVIQTPRSPTGEFAATLQRDYDDIKLASSLPGLMLAFKEMANFIRQMPEEERKRAIFHEMPARPMRFE